MTTTLTRLRGFTRRALFHRGGLLASAGLLPSTWRGASAVPSRELQLGPNIFESIGVRPLINCKGTFTIITGSQSLPEVKRAMDEASRHYVHMDELMQAVGQRLAELTRAEWGIVTAGCAAAITHATAACIAGADPEKMQRVPKLAGLKSEVIMPRYSRNDYDHAARMLGVDMIEVETPEELDRAINPKTAMVLILACPQSQKGPLTTEIIAPIARKRNVPVLVDAAAEYLTIPSIHLQAGAHMVAYSGGKCLRGPQSAGLLLGQKDLLQAAWLNSAPHHAFGRSLKVGKEEIMGMLAAVEMWTKRDHDAEWKQWENWLAHISDRVTKVPGVTTEVLQPAELSNHAPQLRIKWDGAAVGVTGREVEKILLEGSPRIVVGGSSGVRPASMSSSLTIMPYMMMPEDHKIAAEAIYAVLSKPPKIVAPVPPVGEPANVDGQWDVRMEFLLGQATHTLTFEQKGNELVGTHAGETLTGNLRGSVEANQVRFHSSQRIQGKTLSYDFTGTVATDGAMHGTVAMAEYGEARWTARRHMYS